MKRSWPGLLTVALCSLAVWLSRARSSSLLLDSDTAFLLMKIRERGNPWSWFAGDWPLGNHFYRPVSTLAFELDNALYGNRAEGYGATNALLAIAGIVALYWFLRELTDRLSFAISGTVLFTLWTLGLGYWPSLIAGYAVWIVLIGGAVRHGLSLRRYVPAALGLGYLAFEINGLHPLHSRIVDWLPGRTASVMAVFCLLAMAAYARYERLGAPAGPKPEPGPLDPPATRSTQVTVLRERKGWMAFAIVSTALALASYEQAVMLPACILGVAVAFRFQGRRPRWGWHTAFWALLFAYLVLRSVLVPRDVSGYQAQQLRSGAGVWLDLGEYIFSPLGLLVSLGATLSVGLIVLVTWQPWGILLSIAQGISAVWEARREWKWPLVGWALSLLAFLPMAWLKIFEHYHWWPMALRTIFVVGLTSALAKGVVSAWSRPERPAPPRPGPAPGSLPRR